MNNKSCPSGRGSEGHFPPIALGELFVGGDLGHEAQRGGEIPDIFNPNPLSTMGGRGVLRTHSLANR